MIKPHHTIPDLRPNKAMLLKTLVGEHEPRTIPIRRLQPICPSGPKDKHCASEGILGQLVPDKASEAIMALAEVIRFAGHQAV